MHLAPIGIFALIAARLGNAGGGEQFLAEIKAVGLHVVTVLTGLLIHGIILLLILLLVARRGLDYLLGMARALLTAFGTASSSATLPLTMECARENQVDAKAVKFVLPLGATINMDGTALYEAAAVLFIAQAYGIDLSLMQQVIVFVTATLAAIGAAGIPEAGLVTMVIVLTAVGLPLDGIALLLAVDWFLDRFRTTINVWGDSVGAAVIDRLT
jgi:Na+/H+-dicarboxylate symporter